MENDLNERITAVEVKITYLEDMLSKLQDIAVEHTHEIDLLKTESRTVRGKLIEILDGQEGDIPNVRPPHY